MIKQVIWSSTIDWKDNNCSVIFLDGCNFKCSYCHNKELIHLPNIDINDVLDKLMERKSFINKVIISGGEPTISPLFNSLVKVLSHSGFEVGIHTNGSNFKAYQLLQDRIHFVGLDIKSSFKRYNEFTENSCLPNVNESILEYLKHFQHHMVDYEVRTTLDAKMTLEELIEIAQILKNFEIKEWILQPEFVMKDGNYNKNLYYDKFWYDSTLRKLNSILPVRYRGLFYD